MYMLYSADSQSRKIKSASARHILMQSEASTQRRAERASVYPSLLVYPGPGRDVRLTSSKQRHESKEVKASPVLHEH